MAICRNALRIVIAWVPSGGRNGARIETRSPALSTPKSLPVATHQNPVPASAAPFRRSPRRGRAIGLRTARRVKRLLDFGATLHHERALANNRFVDWFTTHHEKRGIGFRLDGDAITFACENYQRTFSRFLFSIHHDFALEHEECRGVSIRQCEFYRLASGEIQVPQVDRVKGARWPIFPIELTRNYAQPASGWRQKH